MATEDFAIVIGAEWLYWSLILTICQVTYLLKEKAGQTSNLEWKVGRSSLLFSRVYEKESKRFKESQKLQRIFDSLLPLHGKMESAGKAWVETETKQQGHNKYSLLEY